MRTVRCVIAVGSLCRLFDRDINGMAGCRQLRERARMQLVNQSISQRVIFNLWHRSSSVYFAQINPRSARVNSPKPINTVRNRTLVNAQRRSRSTRWACAADNVPNPRSQNAPPFPAGRVFLAVKRCYFSQSAEASCRSISLHHHKTYGCFLCKTTGSRYRNTPFPARASRQTPAWPSSIPKPASPRSAS
jgi:hypothetical protein